MLCEVSRIPHFLSNRFDVDFFSSLRDLFTMREHRVSEMESTTAVPRSPKNLTRRELSPKQEERLNYRRRSMHGCVYNKGGAGVKEFGPVIFASAGFGADFTQSKRPPADTRRQPLNIFTCRADIALRS